jgi:hypothetical protein
MSLVIPIFEGVYGINAIALYVNFLCLLFMLILVGVPLRVFFLC